MENSTQQVEMRLYDLNKTLMANSKAMDIEEGKKIVRDYLTDLALTETIPDYFMLLAAEKRDFTVFAFVDRGFSSSQLNSFVDNLFEVVMDRGVLKDVEVKEDGSIDIWVNDVFYKLFDYDWGVIEI